ncbi:MAG: hypothetical protein LBQ91_01450 [Oscillospiraceae bacterium]|jgi:negative regulator of genetic competence, sporulation and motility|nr:hypothetical protein [Oscillospiraceae bacterium]
MKLVRLNEDTVALFARNLPKNAADLPLDDAEDLYIEEFSGAKKSSRSLYIIRKLYGKPFVFRLRGFEDVIALCAALPDDTVSDLVLFEGDYYFFVTPWEMGQPPGACYEFGELIGNHPLLTEYYTERGEVLFSGAAAEEVSRIFGDR